MKEEKTRRKLIYYQYMCRLLSKLDKSYFLKSKQVLLLLMTKQEMIQ